MFITPAILLESLSRLRDCPMEARGTPDILEPVLADINATIAMNGEFDKETLKRVTEHLQLLLDLKILNKEFRSRAYEANEAIKDYLPYI